MLAFVFMSPQRKLGGNPIGYSKLTSCSFPSHTSRSGRDYRKQQLPFLALLALDRLLDFEREVGANHQVGGKARLEC
jgi:hypothetical protein